MSTAQFNLGDLPVAQQAAVLLALDGHQLGGAVLDYQDSRAADHWCDSVSQLRQRLVPSATSVRIPLGCDVSHLNGGVDVIGTLLEGQSKQVVGLIDKANGGVLTLPYASEHSQRTITTISNALDNGTRESVDSKKPCVIALNPEVLSESDNDIDAALLERMAFRISLEGSVEIDWTGWQLPCDAIVNAVNNACNVVVPDDLYAQLCMAALMRGITSMRIPIKALSVARRISSLAGRTELNETDCEQAIDLVVAWRAPLITAEVPQPEQAESEDNQLEENLPDDSNSELQEPNHTDSDGNSQDSQTTQPPPASKPSTLSLPDNLLQLHAAASQSTERHNTSGNSGQQAKSKTRGRVTGTEPYQRGAGQKIHILATLQAAAPWQKWRRSKTQKTQTVIHPQDLRAARYQQSTQTVTVFCVDASGSAAARRLNEAKAAVEMLLADCYVRRDQVAMIVFQGAKAQLVLPPTRSLVRVQRELARLPTGGGTPLASALQLTTQLVKDIKRAGNTPIVCLLTDGRANVDSDGIGGRVKARADALKAASVLSRSVPHSVVIDIAMRASAFAPQLAGAMSARYLPLPGADAQLISGAVSQTRQLSEQGVA